LAVTRQDFENAVAAYWGGKEAQLRISKIAGAVGAGTAGSVRGGTHFDAIAVLLAKFFLEAGYPPSSIRIHRSHRLELPGYYRPQKQWDLVVVHENTLVAAFELKALGGPSFGNNYNNRVEEAIGSAVDLSPGCDGKPLPRREAVAWVFLPDGRHRWLATPGHSQNRCFSSRTHLDRPVLSREIWDLLRSATI